MEIRIGAEAESDQIIILTHLRIPPMCIWILAIMLDRRGILGLEIIQASWLDLDQTAIHVGLRQRLMDRSLTAACAVQRHVVGWVG